jgi:membrane protease subunit HflK
MNEYKTGLLVTSVNMQPAKPPEPVKEAFDDAIKAREDKERLENQAEAYANEILPQARGEAARAVADAKAYRDRVIAEAEGQTSRFTAVLTEFAKAPEVTRERLYLETLENVLGANNTVLLDVPGGDSLMYLPLDQLMGKSKRAQANNTPRPDLSQPTTASTRSSDPRSRNTSRERGSR